MGIKAIVTVELELDEAVKRAAAQNLKRDQRMGLEDDPAKQETIDLYEEEALELLTNSGENYIPEAPDFEHIVLKK